MSRLAWLGIALWAVACDGTPTLDGGMNDAGPDGLPPATCAADAHCGDNLLFCSQWRCRPGEPGTDARGCIDLGSPCATGVECDEAEDTCSMSWCIEGRTGCLAPGDCDGDGSRNELECGGSDCDDDDPDRFPGNPEVCDVAGHDEDCDLSTYGFRDADGDSAPDASCCNGETCGTDCDDMNPSINPSAPEVCGNGVDDDCDGMMDEGIALNGFIDADGDGYGDDSVPMVACPGTPMFATVGGDCNDTEASINPGTSESCDGIDNDCDGSIDDGLPTVRCYRDRDGDGFGVTTEFMDMCGCRGEWASASGDCADDEPGAYPGQTAWHPRTYTVRTGPSSTRQSGDWNCDGVDTLRWPGSLLRTCTGSISCNPEGGWETLPRPPACGVTATFRFCEEVDRECRANPRSRTQECR